MRSFPPFLHGIRLAPVLATLAVGIAGGGLAALAGLPIPWLTGAMAGVAVAAVAGAPMVLPESWRLPVFVVLGISMGSGLTPEAVAAARTWPLSLLALAVAVPAMMLASVAVIARVPGWDRKSALLAATPGALSYVLAVAVESGVDVSRVAIVQAMRLVILVLVLPALIVYIGQAGVPDLPAVHEVPWGELLVLAAACGAGGMLSQRLRVPGGLLFGPMLVSALAHGTGWTHARVPPEVLGPAMLVLGCFIGARFTGIGWRVFRASLGIGILNLVLAMLVAVAFSLAVSALTGLPVGQTLLAFAPGGAEAMAVMAFALDLDPAYVAVHHVARFMGLGLMLPIVLRLLGMGQGRQK